MMRDEMIKRLDAFVDEYGIDEDGGYVGAHHAWSLIRAELVAERCANCAHRLSSQEAGRVGAFVCCAKVASDVKFGHRDLRMGEFLATHDAFCCSHFEKKVP